MSHSHILFCVKWVLNGNCGDKQKNAGKLGNINGQGLRRVQLVLRDQQFHSLSPVYLLKSTVAYSSMEEAFVYFISGAAPTPIQSVDQPDLP